MRCREAARLSSIGGAIRANQSGFILIAKFCDLAAGPPMFFTNVYHLADFSSERYCLVFRANRWSESNARYGIPTVFEENAKDWRPLESFAGLSKLIPRLESLEHDLNEFRSSSMNLQDDLRRLHDEVLSRMEGQSFVVKTRPAKIGVYSDQDDKSFFSGLQTSPIARISAGSEKWYTMSGLAEQFTTRKRIEIPDRHQSIYDDFLKLSSFIDELNEADSSHLLSVSVGRHSEKGWNLHWTFTINISSAENPSKRKNYIYMDHEGLHAALSRLDLFRNTIQQAKLNSSA